MWFARSRFPGAGEGWATIGCLLFALGAAHLAPPQQSDGKELYTKLCAACHGQTGAGDGPALVALKASAANFAEPNFQSSRTDDQLAAAITNGKPPMPGFGKQLAAQQIRSLVAYVRELGDAKKP